MPIPSGFGLYGGSNLSVTTRIPRDADCSKLNDSKGFVYAVFSVIYYSLSMMLGNNN